MTAATYTFIRKTFEFGIDISGIRSNLSWLWKGGLPLTLSEFKTVALSSAASFSLHKHKHNVAISRSRFASFPLIHLFDLSVFCCFLPSDLISGWQKGDIIIIIISRRDYRELFHGGGELRKPLNLISEIFMHRSPTKAVISSSQGQKRLIILALR